MTQDKKLEDISALRERLYAQLQERKSLGAFDTNANTIILLLQSQVDLLGFIISECQLKPKQKQ
jgi:hypothetical protein